MSYVIAAITIISSLLQELQAEEVRGKEGFILSDLFSSLLRVQSHI
jgi:hypothetical protein